ncbi:hypothetical protein LCGC14_1952770 [marine sediment metagenome]|uniref:Uncharacterized protein n=1 Tax=marine sediment metagenome TaxID=412755 RepID=A0A0F9IE10_9ZZZZ
MDIVKKDAINAVKNCVAYDVADAIKQALMEFDLGEGSYVYDTTEGRNWIRIDFKSDVGSGRGRRKSRAFVIRLTESLTTGD